MSTAAQQARYRAAAKKRGTLKKYVSKSKRPSQFKRAEFVAVDGEGFNAGPERVVTAGADETVYTTRAHEYAFLSASDGSELYNPKGRLETKQCLDFLIDIKKNNKNAILCCFGASYDFCHMLAFGLGRDEIDTLLHGDGKPFSRKILETTLVDPKTQKAHDYRIELRNRKSLSIWRWKCGAAKYETYRTAKGQRMRRMTKNDACVLWDVWGFFQGTFSDALTAWLPGDADHAFIREQKALRGVFDRADIDLIRRYNAAELRCLVAIMNRLRESIAALGLEITRWDGAGAIAGAMFRLHNVKDHMTECPPAVFEAACGAYSGGHIEALKIGHGDMPIHHYDVNSAYPHHFRNLPSLAGGVWRHACADATPEPGFTLVRVEYRFMPGLPFYPLFYRTESGTILYPERGSGWYWFAEYDAACAFVAKFGCIEFRVIESWHLEPATTERPFAWIETYYEQRKAIIAESKRTGIPNGAEKIIKTGINSCYGKCAQQVGAQIVDGELTKPAFFQIEYAGAVTAGCRAQIMRAAIEAPNAIISMATDGLFSTGPLPLDCPAEKTLGAWEYQKHDGMTIVMPGIYWLHDDKKSKHYSRGFNKAGLEDAMIVRNAWKAGKTELAIETTRLITLGAAIASDAFWAMRGQFATVGRVLALNSHNSKRHVISVKAKKPHKNLVSTHPLDLLEDYDMPLTNLISKRYDVAWLNSSEPAKTTETAEITEFDADSSFYLNRLDVLNA